MWPAVLETAGAPRSLCIANAKLRRVPQRGGGRLRLHKGSLKRAGQSDDADDIPEAPAPQPSADDAVFVAGPAPEAGSAAPAIAQRQSARSAGQRGGSSAPQGAALLNELNAGPGSSAAAAAMFLELAERQEGSSTDADIDGFARTRAAEVEARRQSADGRSTQAGASAPSASPLTKAGSALPAGVQLRRDQGPATTYPRVAVSAAFAARNLNVLRALQLLGQSPAQEQPPALAQQTQHAVSTSSGQAGVASISTERLNRAARREALRRARASAAGATEGTADSDQSPNTSSSQSEAARSTQGVGIDQGQPGDLSGLGSDWEVRVSPDGSMFLERSKSARPAGPKQSSPQPAADSPLTHQAAKPRNPSATQRATPTSQPRVPAPSPLSHSTVAYLTKGLGTSGPSATSPGTDRLLGPPAGTNQQGGMGSSGSTGPSSRARNPAPAVLTPALSAAPALKQALRLVPESEQVLQLAALLWPVWADAGCRLAAPAVLAVSAEEERAAGAGAELVGAGAGMVGVAPTPAEVALVLQGVAAAARRSGWSRAQCLELCTHPVVLGLVEALRVQPPRLSPEQQANPTLSQALTAAFFRSARHWWLSPPPTQPTHTSQPPLPSHTTQTPSHTHTPSAQITPVINGHAVASLGGMTEGISVRVPDAAHVATSQQAGSQTGIVDPSSASGDSGQRGSTGPGQTAASSASLAEQFAAYVRATGLSGYQSDGGSDSGTETGDARTDTKTDASSSGRDGTHGTQGALQGKRGAGQSGGVSGSARSGPGSDYESLVRQYKARAAQQSQTKRRQSASEGSQATGGDRGVVGLRHQTVTLAAAAMATLAGASAWQQPVSSLFTLAEAGGVRWAQLTPGEAVGLAVSLAVCRHWCTALTHLDTGLAQAGGLSVLLPEERSRLLWSYATLNTVPQRLLDGCAADWAWQQGVAGGQLSSFPTTSLVSSLWALAVLRQTHTHAFRAGWAELLSRNASIVEDECGHVLLTQVWQVALSVWLDPACVTDTAEQPHHTATPTTQATHTDHPTPTNTDTQTQPSVGKAAAMAETCITASLDTVQDLYTSSKGSTGSVQGARDVTGVQSNARGLLGAACKAFAAGSAAVRAGARDRGHTGVQRQIANVVSGLKMMHVVEDTSSGYAVDVSLPDLRIAIEVDGPTHFTRTPGPKGRQGGLWVVGATAMKRRHLRALGWDVLSVSIQEWEAAGSPAVQQALIRKRIADIVGSKVDLQAGV